MSSGQKSIPDSQEDKKKGTLTPPSGDNTFFLFEFFQIDLTYLFSDMVGE